MHRPLLLHPIRVLAVVALAAPLLASADPRYTVTAIAGAGSAAYDLNNLGEVVGTMATAGTSHAFLYGAGGLADIGGAYGASSTAFAINDHGQVVGTAYDSSSYPTSGFLYSGGVLNPIMGTGATSAYGINNAGTVVGRTDVTTPGGDLQTHAYTYANGKFVDLGTLPSGDSSRAQAINSAGDVVGSATISGPLYYPENPFLYRNGVMTDLGNLDQNGIWSRATSINDHGQIVGYSGVDYFPGVPQEIYPRSAFLYQNGNMIDLGGLAPHYSSSASDINNIGQIVGTARIADFDSHAFLFENGAMIDLNVLIDPESGWVIQDAAAINDLQQIAATACRGDVCQAVRLDLVPAVPEPAGYALLLGGLMLGWGIRRPAGRRPG